jgi:crotonobetainyl-CoA:carnitine CoA-transferase CaiB-like acyl-CoA transferase
MQLADLGAEVIKIEDPTVGGDVSRHIPPFTHGTDSLFFESFNRNKMSIALDLRLPEGMAVLHDLVRVSDALVSNLRGDTAAKLRIRYSDLRHLNPRIVCASLSGFGATGRRSGEGGYDYTLQGLAGWMSLTGGPEDPPTKSGLSLVDYCGGYVLALATLGAVWEARREGSGCDADLSLFDTALAQLTYIGTWAASRGFRPQRLPRSAHQTVVPFQAFPTADSWIMIACPKQRLWEYLCEALGRTDLMADKRFSDFAARLEHRQLLEQILIEELARCSTSHWLGVLTSYGVPCAPVNDVEGALADPQVASRETVEEYDHPTLGTVRGIRSPLRVPTAPRGGRGPLLGEHTEELLRQLCGYGGPQLRTLRNAGVFGTSAPVEVSA